MSGCNIEGCDNDIQCPTMGICKACYSTMLYWSKKKPKEMLTRAQKLTKFQSRMDVMMPTKLVYTYKKQSPLDTLPGQVNKKYKKKKKIAPLLKVA